MPDARRVFDVELHFNGYGRGPRYCVVVTASRSLHRVTLRSKLGPEDATAQALRQVRQDLGPGRWRLVVESCTLLGQ